MSRLKSWFPHFNKGGGGNYARPVTLLKKACNFFFNILLLKVFSCEFCEITKNTFSYRALLVAASVICKYLRLVTTSAKPIVTASQTKIDIVAL